MKLTEDTLDEFVRRSDELGGPGVPACDAYWANVGYEPTYQVDQSLDPFSEEYVNEQLALYREMSGRELDQVKNEMTAFDLALHAKAANPYNHPDPIALAEQISRLIKVFRKSGAVKGSHLLDMGCGWGLSSEVAAYLGYQVTAVDINPDFVALVNARAERFAWPIHAVVSEFDTYRPASRVDLVLFYECLHHAVRPWTLIQTMADSLVPRTGKLLLAGEPINDYWWTNWGIRLDPISIYCIRKFGWFESGWSQVFLEQCFQRAGLQIDVEYDANGATVIGQRVALEDHTAAAYVAGTRSDGLTPEGEMALLAGRGFLDVVFPEGATRASLEICNFRPKALNLDAKADSTVVFSGPLPSGGTDLLIERSADCVRVGFNTETWVPDDEIGNGDTRTLGLHLKSVSFT